MMRKRGTPPRDFVLPNVKRKIDEKNNDGYQSCNIRAVITILLMIAFCVIITRDTRTHTSNTNDLEIIPGRREILETIPGRLLEIIPGRDIPHQENREEKHLFDCEHITLSHQHNRSHLPASKINKLRRELMLNDSDDARKCFERHFNFFADTFKSRIHKKHVMLHIPKAGGTSVCKSVRDEGKLKTVGHNCWRDDLCPIWSGCTDPKPTSCEMIKSWNYTDFVMNENWFDGFCEDEDGHNDFLTYSMLLREPLQRTMSHLNHFLDSVDHRENHFKNTKIWRLSLIQSNYMTWALSAELSINKEERSYDLRKEEEPNSEFQQQQQQLQRHPKYFRPSREDLDVAMSNLSGMDYVVDLQHPNKSCTNRIMNVMQIEGDVVNAKHNVAIGDYTSDFHAPDVGLLNELDISLYKYATQLINVDCIFLELLDNRLGAEVEQTSS